MMKYFVPILMFATLLSGVSFSQQPDSLESWLATDAKDRKPIEQLEFAKKPLTKSAAAKAIEQIWQNHVEHIRATRAAEWKAKKIKLGDLEMKFEYKIFGKKPKDGRSLFISMHGGGGAPARVNEQQWRNQIRLYQPKEGIYLAPRAPTNTWNLWHQGHIDDFFTRIIEDAIVLADVNPNRVYIMGYSAGGDGVYQLAPRMADQLAAAAMMAGHPNGVSPLGLRNIGFTLHMGGKDRAYKRNEVARQWKKRLAELKKQDPSGYEHKVVIHEQFGHWMQRKDAVAVPWMAKFTRKPFPKKIIWHQTGRTHDRFYWLAVDQKNKKGGALAVVSRDGQVFTIEKTEKLKKLRIRLNDEMIDLDQPIVVKMGDQELFKGKVNRNIATIVQSLTDRGDPKTVYSASIEIKLPEKK